MVNETDGIEEAFEEQLRAMVSGAKKTADKIARIREELRRRMQEASELEAKQIESRIADERRAARSELTDIYSPEWWERATPEQISHAYETARAWRSDNLDFARAEERIGGELRMRYGIDVSQTTADAKVIRNAMREAQRDLSDSDLEFNYSSIDDLEAQQQQRLAEHEEFEAVDAQADANLALEPEERDLALAEAEQHETAADSARSHSRAAYDSSDRRAEFARDLESRGVEKEVVATRMRADISQGRPARDAVRRRPSHRMRAAKRRTLHKARSSRGR